MVEGEWWRACPTEPPGRSRVEGVGRFLSCPAGIWRRDVCWGHRPRSPDSGLRECLDDEESRSEEQDPVDQGDVGTAAHEAHQQVAYTNADRDQG